MLYRILISKLCSPARNIGFFYIAFFISWVLFALSPAALAQHPDTTGVGQLAELSFDELINLKVVSASGLEQKLTEAPSTMIVITAQQIKERGYEQLEDALRDVQGIDLVHVGGYFPTVIYFRGMYGAENLRTLLMIDGIRENNLLGTPDIAGPAYSLHNVDRIEIIWGPASALYGADAFGGVINIITKKGADVNGAYYEKGRGDFNTTTDRFMLGTSRGSFDLFFSGSFYSTDGPKLRNRDPYYTGSSVDNARSFQAGITHTGGKFKTSLSYRSYTTPMSFGLALNSATKLLNLPAQGHNNSGAIGILMEDIGGERGSLYETFSRTVTLQTDYTVSPKLSLHGLALYRETGLGEDSYAYLSIDTTLYASPGVVVDIDTNHLYRLPTVQYCNRVRFELNGSYILNRNNRFYAGVQVYQDNLERQNRGQILDTGTYVITGIPVINRYPVLLPRIWTIRNNFGSFLQYELSTSLFRSTKFTAGVRYDKNTDYDNPISPRFAIVNQPTDKVTLKLMFGTAFRAPTPAEVATTIAVTGGVPENPEKVNTYEANVLYHSSGRSLLQLNFFRNELSDIFVQNSLIGGGLETRLNRGSAEINGAELRYDMTFSGNLSGFLNFTFQDGEQTDLIDQNTVDIPNLPGLKGNAGIAYRVKDLFTITGIGNWVGERDLPASNPYGIGRGQKLEDYFLTNVVLTTRKIFAGHVSASLDVRNVFNVGYLDPGIRSADGALYSTVLEQPGRTMFFKVMVSF